VRNVILSVSFIFGANERYVSFCTYRHVGLSAQPCPDRSKYYQEQKCLSAFSIDFSDRRAGLPRGGAPATHLRCQYGSEPKLGEYRLGHQSDHLYGNDHRRFAQPWLVYFTHCLQLCADQSGLCDLLAGRVHHSLEESKGLLVHIGLALFSYATLIIAALYALQLAWLDYQLKNKRLSFTADMPPLMTIERKLFHITQVGVILLTLTLCTGLLYMDNLFSRENIDKAVLSILAWFVYIVLLWGHYHEGWRGRRVVWFSMVGAVLLTLAYFGSRMIQQFMTH